MALDPWLGPSRSWVALVIHYNESAIPGKRMVACGHAGSQECESPQSPHSLFTDSSYFSVMLVYR